MRVFRHLMVVGVGAAITFSNVGRSASVPPPTQPQDSSTESNQLQFGSDFKSAPKTKRERKSQEGYIPVVSPPTPAEESPTETNPPPFQPEFKSAAKTAAIATSGGVRTDFVGAGSPESLTPKDKLSKPAPTPRLNLQEVPTPSQPQEPPTETNPPPFQPEFKSAAKTAANSSSQEVPTPSQPQEPPTETNPPPFQPEFKLATLTTSKGKSAATSEVSTAEVSSSSEGKQPESPQLSATFKGGVREKLKVPRPTAAEARTQKEPIAALPATLPPGQNPAEPTGEIASGMTPREPVEIKPVNRLSEIAQATGSTSAPLQSFPPPTPKGNLETKPPSYLEPNPNPLNFPTQPSEVRIEGTQPITLQQAIDLARRSSQTIQVADLQLQQSKAVLQEQRAALFPDLTLQSSLSHSLSAGGEISLRAQERQARSLGRTLNARNYANTTFSNNLQLSYNVDLFGATAANIQAAKEQVRVRELEVERLVEQLRFDVTSAYYDLQNADGQVAIGQAAVRNAQKSLQDAEALERAGVGTRFAVLQAQVNLANEQQNLNQASRDQRINRRRLTELLNVNPSADLTAADPVEQAGVWGRTLEDSILLAFQNRAELEEQLVQRAQSKQQRRAALAALYPQLRLSASYNLLGQDSGDPNRFLARGWADGYTLQATLTWNIFDGGASRARVKQREADMAIAETRFDQLRGQVRREVEQAYFQLESSFASIETAEAGVEQAREALRLARLRFQAGVGTQTDVIQAETDLTRAERNRLSAIIGYNRALSSLQRAVSNLPSNDLSDIP